MKRSRPRYTVLYHPCDDGWSAFFPAFPNLIVWFKGLDRTKREAPKALKFHIEVLRRTGARIPVEGRRPVELRSVAV